MFIFNFPPSSSTMLIFLMHYTEVHATELVLEQAIFSLALLFEE